MLAKLGCWCFVNRRVVLGSWVAVVVLLIAGVQVIGSGFEAILEAPDSETADGFDALDRHFGGQGTGLSGQVVFSAEQGLTDPEVMSSMQEMLAEVSEMDGVAVGNPFGGPGGGISPDGSVGYATVDLDADIPGERGSEFGADIAALAPFIDGLTVEIGGEALSEFEPPQSELIGIAFAIVILIAATGSVLAMGLPLGVAIFGVGGGLAATTLLSNFTHGPEFSTIIATMVGLGVGIDYALFIVTRYREELHKGASSLDATVKAMDTAGRAVLFAGITVVFSLLGLLVIGLAFITGIGIAASTTVLVTMISSLTLLPALLGFAGDRVEVSRYRGLVTAGLVAIALLGIGLGLQLLILFLPLAAVVFIAGFAVGPLKKQVPPRVVKPVRETLAYRWSRTVQSRPWLVGGLGVLILATLTLPLFSLRLGFSDEGNFAEDTTTRRAYDTLAEGFGPGFNGPLLITVELGDPTDAAGVEVLVAALDSDPGIAAIAAVVPSDREAPAAFLVQAIPTTAPQDLATEQTIGRLRDEVVPAAVSGTGLDVNITGNTAAGVDFSDYLARRIPVFFAAVLLLSFVLLMAVFRSVLVPLKAVIMNLLSISAAYGVVVALFQWGWASSFTGIEPAPIEPFIPMMLFAIVFGLSMDYEVFLLSRVREEFVRSGDAVESVADGLASTARVITAAAAIMVVVFGSFILEDNRVPQIFGTGLGAAIFLDATLVRMLLVPATMELLGERNWWMPAWLDRVVPRLNVEGSST